ncbi:MAG TPA: DnaB-like helicase C-terminal domain-containing protein [Aggregatilineales bacterium]|nr:AAA family ATPase [Anaerolineales bacterium]HRE46522.1 DnaB-like helicase C-terminal domain-containing protein [Aggregatilineales bacterium]
MSTRRFPDDNAPSPASPPDPTPGSGTALPTRRPVMPGQTPGTPVSRAPKRTGKSIQHMPRTLSQVLNDANEQVVRGDLSEYVPLPTGFDPLDGLIGGGLRKTELVLLGGAQGIGKTIAAVQMARNIAMRPDQYVFYLSYEHTETHLMSRLLCLESINPPEVDLRSGLKLKDLFDTIISQRAREILGRDNRAESLQSILRENPRTSMALARLSKYADRFIMVKASPAVTTLSAIREMTGRLAEATGGNLTVFVDYLQKIAIHPERAADENDKVTIVVEGLKDIALSLGVPVLSIVASDRDGLRAKRLHLFHLRGSSALDYECDIAIIMNNKYQILAKDHIAFNPYQGKQFRDWVVFTVEKNRAGRAMMDMEFQLHAPYFAFDPRGQQVQQTLIDDKIIES